MQKDEAERIAQKVADMNGGTVAGSKLKSFTLEIQVHRAATGKVEDYGVVSAYHSNPIRNAIAQLSIWLRGLRRKHGNKCYKKN